MKKIFSMTICLLLIPALIAGCQIKETPGTNLPSNIGGEEPSGGEDTPAPSGDEPGGVYAPELVIGVPSKVTTLDPQGVNNIIHNTLFMLTHEPLVRLDEETGEIRPALALDWTMADDLRTWTFNLRKDVFFHDGGAFSAQDVVFTFTRGAEEGSGTIRNTFSLVESVAALDAHTVRITLLRPNMDFLMLIGTPNFGILSEQALKDDADSGAQVGTGAWVVETWAVGDYNSYLRFEEYWGEQPLTQRLKFRYIPEGAARMIALETGEIDVCQTPENADLDILRKTEGLTLVEYDATSLNYFAFNTQRAPGDDVNFRLAVAHAIDVDSIISGVLDGLASPAKSFWGWHQFGYIDAGEYAYDLDLAKEYLSRSGYPDGVQLEIMTASRQRVLIAEILHSQLKAIGVEVVVNEVDSAGLTAMSNAGEHQSMIYSITFTKAADDARRAYQSGSTTNKSFYNSERIHELMDIAVSEPDESRRLEYYSEWQKIAYEECPLIPLFFPKGYVGVKEGVEGAVFASSGTFDYTYARRAAE